MKQEKRKMKFGIANKLALCFTAAILAITVLIGSVFTVLFRDYSKNIYWVFGILLKEDSGMDAEEAMKKLAENKIGTRPFFYPMHRQPVFKKMGLFEGESH